MCCVLRASGDVDVAMLGRGGDGRETGERRQGKGEEGKGRRERRETLTPHVVWLVELGNASR